MLNFRSIQKPFAFFSGSTMGAIIDYGATLLLTYAFGLTPTLALGISMVVSASLVFLFHEFITFTPSGGSRWRRFRAFLVLAVVVFLLRGAILSLLLWVNVPLALALLFAIAFAAAVNYLISAKKIFL